MTFTATNTTPGQAWDPMLSMRLAYPVPRPEYPLRNLLLALLLGVATGLRAGKNPRPGTEVRFLCPAGLCGRRGIGQDLDGADSHLDFAAIVLHLGFVRLVALQLAQAGPSGHHNGLSPVRVRGVSRADHILRFPISVSGLSLILRKSGLRGPCRAVDVAPVSETANRAGFDPSGRFRSHRHDRRRAGG